MSLVATCCCGFLPVDFALSHVFLRTPYTPQRYNRSAPEDHGSMRLVRASGLGWTLASDRHRTTLHGRRRLPSPELSLKKYTPQFAVVRISSRSELI